MPAIVDTLLKLLEIESCTGNEKALCDYVESVARARLAPLGKAAQVQRLDNSLIVRGPHDQHRKTICLAGHLDTVSGPPSAISGRLDGDRIVGLGASDMKSGLAVMLELLSKDVLLESKYNLIEVFYSGEEGPAQGNSIRKVLSELQQISRPDFCYILEPTNNTLQLGCLGSLHALVSFQGQRAHSARPWEGENAVYKALPLIARLSALEVHEVLSGGLPFREAVTITNAHTGDNPNNVVPDSFQLNLNYRFAPGRDIADVKKHILQLVSGSAALEFIDLAPACPVPQNDPVLAKFQELFNLPIHPKQAYTDVAACWEFGIAAANCGPGLTAQAHQTGEFVLVPDLLRSYDMYKQFLLTP